MEFPPFRHPSHSVLSFIQNCIKDSPLQWRCTEKPAYNWSRLELKRSPFKAWSRSVYRHTCYAYCQGFLPCLFLHSRSIHLHFSKPSPIFPVSTVSDTGFCVGPQNKKGHPAGCRFPCRVPAGYKLAQTNMTCVK